jgi:hypothetical protein
MDEQTTFDGFPIPSGPVPAIPVLLEPLRARLRRYLILSTAVAGSALALAVGVSLIALVFAGAPEARTEAAAEPVAVGEEALLAEPQEINPALSVGGQPRLVTKNRIENVNITFYDCADQGFCGRMANGRRVYQGAAACSWNLEIGTMFFIVGDPTRRLYMCEDRGLLDDTWVDIFWYFPTDGWSWQSGVGRYGTIEIVE